MSPKKLNAFIFIEDDLWDEMCPSCSTSDCRTAINEFAFQVLSYGRHSRVILDAANLDQTCIVANCLAAAYLLGCNGLSRRKGSGSFMERLANILSKKVPSKYEKLLYSAVMAMEIGKREEALNLHFTLVENFPSDLLSLKRGQLLGFYLGRPDLMLKLTSLCFPYNKNRPFFHGMFAFALLENGRLKEASQWALRGLQVLPEDTWSQHAHFHTLQETGQHSEVVQLSRSWNTYWENCGSFLYSHMWWHTALCQLAEDSENVERALVTYDHHIMGGPRVDSGSPMVHLNALSLLVKAHLLQAQKSPKRERMALESPVGSRLLSLALLIHSQRTWCHDILLLLFSLWAFSISSPTSSQHLPSPRKPCQCPQLSMLPALVQWTAELPSDLTGGASLQPLLISVAHTLMVPSGRHKVDKSQIDTENCWRPNSISSGHLRVLGGSVEQLNILCELIQFCHSQTGVSGQA